MRLSDVTFPIAVRRPTALWGGRQASLGGFRQFGFQNAAFYLNGGYDDAIIYDATGRRFSVIQIELRKPHFIHFFLRRAGHLFVLPERAPLDQAAIDMDLEQTGTLTLAEFRSELLPLVLANPQWWKRFLSEDDVSDLFTQPSSIPEIINAIGMLSGRREETLPGTSSKCRDLRQIRSWGGP